LETVVAERKEAIESVEFIGGRIVASTWWMCRAGSRSSSRREAGGDVPLPGTGSVGGLGGRDDHPDIWYAFTSPLSPTTIHRSTQRAGTDTTFEAATHLWT
jgi:prolyl oligopeptidase